MFFTPKCSQYTPTYTVCTACVPCATPMRPNLSRICENHLSEEYFLRTNTLTEYASFSDIIQFTILLFVLVLSISVCFCKNLDVKFISFDTNLSLLKQYPEKKTKTESYLYLILLLFLVIDTSFDINIAMFLHLPIDVYPVFPQLSGFRKFISRIGPFAFCLQLLASAICPETHLLCLFIMFITCTSITKKVPLWVTLLLILLSNDIEMNPGPSYHDNFFTFMNWNLNSLVNDNFQRVQAIEAHNALFNYDLISICETSLNDSIEIPDPLLNDYTFIPSNHPDNVSHGGVGLFYKNTLPLKRREDLSFDETIVVELKFGRKKIFFTVLYRTPSLKHNTPGFNDFLINFKTLNTNIQSENPYAVFYTGDFNGHSKLWWPEGDTTPEGKSIEELFTNLNLSQLISEPTNFTPNKNPSCIDLLVTDQPNLMLDCGTRPSLDPKCHHQIVFGKINLKIPPPPPVERKIWHYNKANTDAIKRSMKSYPWAEHLGLNPDPNWQTKSFTEILLNIMSNFIPNEMKKSVPRDPPWIDKNLKLLLKKKTNIIATIKNMVIGKRTRRPLSHSATNAMKPFRQPRSRILKN